MAKFKLIRLGDRRGVGAIVEQHSIFGVSRWTLCPNLGSNGDVQELWGLDKWTCLVTGKEHHRHFWSGSNFYAAQFLTATETFQEASNGGL